ncbi:hypothetical protein D3C71_1594480 [compost metagenome]
MAAVSHHRRRFFGVGRDNHRRRQRAVVRQIFQRIDDLFLIPRRFTDFPQHVGRAAVTVAHIVGQHVVAYRLLRRQLQLFGDGGVDLVTVGIGVVAITLDHLLTHHLGEIRGGEADFRCMVVGHQFFATGLIVLRLSDVMLIQHARQHHVAASYGAIVGVERIEGRWSFRQAGDGRHFA